MADIEREYSERMEFERREKGIAWAAEVAKRIGLPVNVAHAEVVLCWDDGAELEVKIERRAP